MLLISYTTHNDIKNFSRPQSLFLTGLRSPVGFAAVKDKECLRMPAPRQTPDTNLSNKINNLLAAIEDMGLNLALKEKLMLNQQRLAEIENMIQNASGIFSKLTFTPTTKDNKRNCNE